MAIFTPANVSTRKISEYLQETKGYNAIARSWYKYVNSISLNKNAQGKYPGYFVAGNLDTDIYAVSEVTTANQSIDKHDVGFQTVKTATKTYTTDKYKIGNLVKETTEGIQANDIILKELVNSLNIQTSNFLSRAPYVNYDSQSSVTLADTIGTNPEYKALEIGMLKYRNIHTYFTNNIVQSVALSNRNILSALDEGIVMIKEKFNRPASDFFMLMIPKIFEQTISTMVDQSNTNFNDNRIVLGTNRIDANIIDVPISFSYKGLEIFDIGNYTSPSFGDRSIDTTNTDGSKNTALIIAKNSDRLTFGESDIELVLSSPNVENISRDDYVSLQKRVNAIARKNNEDSILFYDSTI